jgi:hypothetical protein
MKAKQEFFGFNPVMWMGVVEDNEDPIKLGRLRVRIFGWHTQQTTGSGTEPGVATSDLPWAHVMQPVSNAPNSGLGGPLTGIHRGTWVMGMFLDGELAREPLVMGSLGGIPVEYSKGPDKGFYDPSTTYPRKHPTDSWDINEPDTNRLARNDNVAVHGDPEDFEHKIIQTKKDGQVKAIVTARGFAWEEPILDSDELTPDDGRKKEWKDFKAKYPDNKVLETESGHIIEVDDTAGEERIHIYHKSGTYVNIDKQGRMTTKVMQRNLKMSMVDDLNYVAGEHNITVGGDSNHQCKNMLINTTGFTVRASGGALIEGGLYVVGSIGGSAHPSGSFSTPCKKSVTVKDGIVTSIVQG